MGDVRSSTGENCKITFVEIRPCVINYTSNNKVYNIKCFDHDSVIDGLQATLLICI